MNFLHGRREIQDGHRFAALYYTPTVFGTKDKSNVDLLGLGRIQLTMIYHDIMVNSCVESVD